MLILLSDHNCEGQAQAIFAVLERLGYAQMLGIVLRLFTDVGLPINADDEQVWRYCQVNSALLLTGNRKARGGENTLESVLRRLTTSETLPVLTIGNVQRILSDRVYCRQCADRLADYVLALENYRGTSRLYLP